VVVLLSRAISPCGSLLGGGSEHQEAGSGPNKTGADGASLLDGLNQSADLNAFVMHESIAEPPADLNGDGDTTDPVIKLSDRVTGSVEAIGIAGSEGRAVARVQQPPFSFPVLAVEDDVVAFLEPEPWQAATDTNNNARVLDTILRVYRLGMGEATNPSAPIASCPPGSRSSDRSSWSDCIAPRPRAPRSKRPWSSMAGRCCCGSPATAG